MLCLSLIPIPPPKMDTLIHILQSSLRTAWAKKVQFTLLELLNHPLADCTKIETVRCGLIMKYIFKFMIYGDYLVMHIPKQRFCPVSASRDFFHVLTNGENVYPIITIEVASMLKCNVVAMLNIASRPHPFMML